MESIARALRVAGLICEVLAHDEVGERGELRGGSAHLLAAQNVYAVSVGERSALFKSSCAPGLGIEGTDSQSGAGLPERGFTVVSFVVRALHKGW